MDEQTGRLILDHLRQQRAPLIDFLRELVLTESPSNVPEAQARPLAMLGESLASLDFDVQLIPGQQSGGHLEAWPRQRRAGAPLQLLLGHCDTVWPIGTLATMPVQVNDGMMTGPGVYDMKAGLTSIIFALRALRALNLELPVTPIVFINSDEEIGSDESTPHIIRLAQQANRVYVMEPALGREGKIKTARKGIGRFDIQIEGRAAHAGLDPEKGISAIREMGYVIQKLFDLNAPERGVSVNVGIVEGGLRPNVIAPTCRAVVDVRAPTMDEAATVESAINNLQPTTPGTSLRIECGVDRYPLERTPRNQALWQLAQQLGPLAGLSLEEGMAGGGSDGNTTSQYTATLDGLGAVGDGAHAVHEFVDLERTIERCALLALLMLAPAVS